MLPELISKCSYNFASRLNPAVANLFSVREGLHSRSGNSFIDTSSPLIYHKLIVSFLTSSRIKVSSLVKIADITMRMFITSILVIIIAMKNFPTVISSNFGLVSEIDLVPDILHSPVIFLVSDQFYSSSFLLLPILSASIVYLLLRINTRSIKIWICVFYFFILFNFLVIAPALTEILVGPSSPKSFVQLVVTLFFFAYFKMPIFINGVIIMLLIIFFKFPKKEPGMENGITTSENQGAGN